MKITSPVGEYDYHVNRVRLGRRGRVVVHGNLGVWDTTMELEPREWLPVAAALALLIGFGLRRT